MTEARAPGSGPTEPVPHLPGPGFLDAEGLVERAQAGTAPRELDGGEGLETDAAALPRGPVLLEAAPDAPTRVDVGWKPGGVAPPHPRPDTLGWIAAGLCVLLVSWVALSLASFVMGLLAQSLTLGLLALAAVALGGSLVAYGGIREFRAYRSLTGVGHVRAVLASRSITLPLAQDTALGWLHQVDMAVPDRVAVEHMLRIAITVAEVRAVLRSQVADRLKVAAAGLGRRAAIEGATLMGICPHPAWDGVLAGLRGLAVIRQVAALYGLRPGFAVTLALMRRVAWTAAGTAGVEILSHGIADQVLGSLPVLKHVTGALPGSGIVAVRLYRLASITAEACSPVT